MQDHHGVGAIMWREADHRCELWNTDGEYELRVYVSDVLTYREPVRHGTGGLQQAAKLLSNAQAALVHAHSHR
jgi:hypothetical protein